jgi:hypothetical protein
MLTEFWIILYRERDRATCSSRAVIGGFNLLDAELNPICHLLALLGAHHILHISRIRVKYPVGPDLCILYCCWQPSDCSARQYCSVIFSLKFDIPKLVL